MAKLNELELWYVARDKAEHEHLASLVEAMPIDVSFEVIVDAMVAPDPGEGDYDLSVSFGMYQIPPKEDIGEKLRLTSESARIIDKEDFERETVAGLTIGEGEVVVRYHHNGKEATAILRHWRGVIS